MPLCRPFFSFENVDELHGDGPPERPRLRLSLDEVDEAGWWLLPPRPGCCAMRALRKWSASCWSGCSYLLEAEQEMSNQPPDTTTDAGAPAASDEYSLTVGPAAPICCRMPT